MVRYSQTQLNQRNTIFQSQKRFWSFLDSNMINKLVHLFDDESKNSNVKISNYIENERQIQGLDMTHVTISGEVYGQKEAKPTLHLGIKKNNKDFLHLSLHLSIDTLNPKNQGPIHFLKNVYCKKGNVGKKLAYALILIRQPENKPKSLEFSIADGYSTKLNNAHLYDYELQQEMKVIITVLNRIFDEDNKEFYIGNENKLFSIHNKTDTVLENINRFSKSVTLKNKGVRMYPPLNNGQQYVIQRNKRMPKIKSKAKCTRKIRM